MTEKFGQSLEALGNILGKDASKERFVNRTNRTDQDFSQWKLEHRRAFPKEYELYNTALRLNQKQLAWYCGSRRSFRSKANASWQTHSARESYSSLSRNRRQDMNATG